jgi:hypothetical protein
MSTITYPSDVNVNVRGTLTVGAVVLPDNAITSSAKVIAGANISADKTEQRVFPTWQQPNSAATTETRPLFVARRPGTLNEIIAGSIAAAIGDSTTTVNVKKNGTTVMSSVITLTSADVARIVQVGAISGGGAFVAGDWFEVTITATIGTGTLPTGVFVQCEMDMDGS